MPKVKLLYFLFITQVAVSQTVEIFGKVEGKKDVENIHVINTTAQRFTTTNARGEFSIAVTLNDTLSFSSIQYKIQHIVINTTVISTKKMSVKLDEFINELDEITIGKVLTGNLTKDVKNTEGEPPINFYDVGIPGYTGKLATQSERRLSAASSFGPSLLFLPIINAITGRTKMLKNRVKIEEKERLIQHIKSRLSKDFLASNPLEDQQIMDFFYFCADDEDFLKHCKNESDFKILIFLRMKYEEYKKNLNTVKE